MSVYNGAHVLRETIDSVLSQEEIDLELIVVDDGSTDCSGKILIDYALRNTRVNLISQRNQGLTAGLIAGCAQARGRYIARQDCGDVSLPGRFARQRDILDTEPAIVMISCATQFVGPSNEELYTVVQLGEELEEGLSQLTVEKVRGPSHHGSTMFRRSSYENAGGYRAAFSVAQDLDLWLRLSEVGRCYAISEVLYKARMEPGSISAFRRDEQVWMARWILDCAAARRSGKAESAVLSRGHELTGLRTRGWCRSWPNGNADAEFYYFVARVLARNYPERSRLYYWKSICSSMFYARAWAGLVRSAMPK
jgi:glycosyltransferase involved in cell wall biosynthesis